MNEFYSVEPKDIIETLESHCIFGFNSKIQGIDNLIDGYSIRINQYSILIGFDINSIIFEIADMTNEDDYEIVISEEIEYSETAGNYMAEVINKITN